MGAPGCLCAFGKVPWLHFFIPGIDVRDDDASGRHKEAERLAQDSVCHTDGGFDLCAFLLCH